jgi:hypothetical protein
MTVTVSSFVGIADAADNIRKWIFLNEDTLPEHLSTRLKELSSLGTSPVDTLVKFVEMVYANPTEFDDTAKGIAAGAALVGEFYNFHGLADEHRGSLISQVLAGETVAADQIPTPSDEYLPSEEPPALPTE